MKSIITLVPYLLMTMMFVQCGRKSSDPVYGTWKSVGYGKYLVLDSLSYRFYDHTRISCLPAQQGDISLLDGRMQLKSDTLIISKGTSLYFYTRTNQLPEACYEELTEDKKKDPVYNFEVFVKTIEEHYAYFGLNKIQWDSLYQVTRQKVTPQTTEATLYIILEELIETLQDNHGYVEPTDEVYEQAEKLRPITVETDTLPEIGDFQVAKVVADAYLQEDLAKDTWLVHWGKMENNIGYIQLKTMWLFADLDLSKEEIKEKGYINAYVDAFTKLNEGEYIKKERAGVAKVMDSIMNDLQHTDTIVLDIRFNGGGQDAVALEVIKRFNDKKRVIATKKTRVGQGYTNSIPIYLEASDQPYLKPVYVLTSQQTGSAAEMATMATLGLPHIKRIGSHTQGATSDALEKRLPNGWYFTTSNEVYLDVGGKSYENLGVPVDYKLNYPKGRQTFFRSIISDVKGDQKMVLQAIEALQTK